MTIMSTATSKPRRSFRGRKTMVKEAAVLELSVLISRVIWCGPIWLSEGVKLNGWPSVLTS